MLAGWARLKYPHLFHAAVSSSSPMMAQLDFPEVWCGVVRCGWLLTVPLLTVPLLTVSLLMRCGAVRPRCVCVLSW